MRRWLLLALLATLGVGAVLDGTVHRFFAGTQTIGQERGDIAASGDSDRDHTAYTLLESAEGYGYPDGRYSLYLVMRQSAPGAEVVIDPATPSVADHFARALGAAGMVRREPIDAGTLSAIAVLLRGREADEAGVYRYGNWELRIADDPVARLLVLHDGTTTQLIDAKLLPDAAGGAPAPRSVEEATSARSSNDPPSLVRAATVETAILLTLLLAGGLVLPRNLAHPAIRVPLALIVGIALLGTSGLARLPGLGGLVAVVTVSGLVGVAARRQGLPTGWRANDGLWLVAALVGLASVVTWARWFTFVKVTPDSHHYLAGGAALADGHTGLASVTVKRGVAQQALHAPGFNLGAEGLQAVGVVVLVATVALLAGLLLRSAGRMGIATTALVCLIAVASPQLRVFAAYVNSHMLVAGFLVAFAVLLAAKTSRDERSLLPAVIALTGAIVLSRAEGPLLVGLLLLGTLAVPSQRFRWSGAWRALGVIVLAWFGLLQLGQPGLSPAFVLLAVTGVIALLAPDVLKRLPPKLLQRIPLAAGIVLWAITTALLVTSVLGLTRVTFVDAARENLGRGAGLWGTAGFSLLLLAVVVIALGGDRDPMLAPGRWLLIGFVPVTMLAKMGDRAQGADATWADLLGGGGRVGWGDSVNRMWMHVALVVLLLAVLHLREDQGRAVSGPNMPSSRSPRVQTARTAALGLVAVWIATQWQPDALPRPTGVDVRAVAVTGDRPIGELIDGAVVQQDVSAATVELPEAGVPRAVCVDVRVVTYARVNQGTVTFSVSHGGATQEQTFAAGDLSDWQWVRTCVDLDEVDRPLVSGPLPPVSVEVRADGAPPGAAISVLQADTAPAALGIGALGAQALVADETGDLVDRATAPLVMEVLVLHDPPSAPLSRAIDRIALLAPWVMLLLGGAVMATGSMSTERPKIRRGKGREPSE